MHAPPPNGPLSPPDSNLYKPLRAYADQAHRSPEVRNLPGLPLKWLALPRAELKNVTKNIPDAVSALVG